MHFKRAAKKSRRFTKDQQEGIARILDGIAQAFIIGATIGSVGFTENKIDAFTAAFILLLAFGQILIAFLIRGSKEFRNVH